MGEHREDPRGGGPIIRSYIAFTLPTDIVGYPFLPLCGAALSSVSVCQAPVALSTTEAEVYALMLCVRAVICICTTRSRWGMWRTRRSCFARAKLARGKTWLILALLTTRTRRAWTPVWSGPGRARSHRGQAPPYRPRSTSWGRSFSAY